MSTTPVFPPLLTKSEVEAARLLFAGVAMHAMVSRSSPLTVEQIVEGAFHIADTMIAKAGVKGRP